MWWGTYELEIKSARRWHIGPRALIVGRQAQEWRVLLTSDTPDARSEAAGYERLPFDHVNWSDPQIDRFILGQSSDLLHLRPALADRPVITRSEGTLRMPPGESMTLYVSSPVWCQVAVGVTQKQLLDVPLLRPSDTWFGASTTDGELCYANRVVCSVVEPQAPALPHRAITAVHIANRASSELLIERMSLPGPNLSLFWQPQRGLCTEDVRLENIDDASLTRLEIVRQSTQRTTLVAGPRKALGQGSVLRAFGSFWRKP